MRTHEGLRIENAGEFLKERFPEREALLSPWLRQRQNCLLYAPSGIGKSFLAWSIALAVTGGGGVGLWSAPKPRKVLVVDGEMDGQDLWERLNALLAADASVDADAVKRNLELLARQRQASHVAFPDLDKPEGRRTVLSIVQSTKAELVILDNFSTLCAVEDENAAGSWNGMQRFLIDLKQDGVSGLLVHHSRKGGKEKDSYRGTSKMSVVFDIVARLDEPPDTLKPADGAAAFKLTFEKVRTKREKSTEPTVLALQEFGWAVLGNDEGDMDLLLKLHRQLKFTSQTHMAAHFSRDKSWVTRMKKKAVAQEKITEFEWNRLFERAKGLEEDLTAPIDGEQSDF